jgi:peptidyl-prolyl cis-trans isomerase A (cyclophilin A)
MRHLKLALCVGVAAVAAGVMAPAGAQGKKPVVVLTTSMGNIEIELNPQKAPVSTKNFLDYVKSGHYNGTVFHRVIPNFMIQGGGMKPDLSEKSTKAPIQNEAKNGLKNARGTIAMARTGEPHSATSQFFISVKNNTNLDYPSFDGWGYAVFGKVTKGMDVVDKIVHVATATKGPHENVPVTPVIIKSAKIK